MQPQDRAVPPEELKRLPTLRVGPLVGITPQIVLRFPPFRTLGMNARDRGVNPAPYGPLKCRRVSENGNVKGPHDSGTGGRTARWGWGVVGSMVTFQSEVPWPVATLLVVSPGSPHPPGNGKRRSNRLLSGAILQGRGTRALAKRGGVCHPHVTGNPGPQAH